jgi:hypothetical protein
MAVDRERTDCATSGRKTGSVIRPDWPDSRNTLSRHPEIEELNIGHNIIARASLVGMDRAVREMIQAMKRNYE